MKLPQEIKNGIDRLSIALCGNAPYNVARQCLTDLLKEVIGYCDPALRVEEKPEKEHPCNHTRAKTRYHGATGMYSVQCKTCGLVGETGYSDITAWRRFFNAVEHEEQQQEKLRREENEQL